MTQFEDFEILYNEFIKATNEIQKFIEKEDYKSANSKLALRDKLMKKILLAKKTVDFSEEENQKIQLIEQKTKEIYTKNIESLKKLHSEMSNEINKNKKKFKISSAYSIYQPKKQGHFIDVSE